MSSVSCWYSVCDDLRYVYCLPRAYIYDNKEFEIVKKNAFDLYRGQDISQILIIFHLFCVFRN